MTQVHLYMAWNIKNLDLIYVLMIAVFQQYFKNQNQKQEKQEKSLVKFSIEKLVQ